MKSFKIILGLLSVILLMIIVSCGTEVAQQPEKSEKESVIYPEKEADKKTQTEPKPEEFTPINFANNLQATLEKTEVNDALKMFDDIPEEYKEDYDINLMHASLLVSAGDVQQAAEVSQKLIEKDPNNVDVLFLNSMIAKKAGDTKKRTELLNKIISIEPNNSDALLEMAHDQMNKKKPNYKNARKLYEKSLKSNENQLEAWIGYGQSSYYLREDDIAKNAFEKVLEKDQNYSMAYAFLAKLSAEEGKFIEATEYIKKAIELDEDYYDYWIDCGQYLKSRGKITEAIECWTKAIELNPDYFLSYVYRSSAYDELEQYDKSIEDYRKIISLNPKYPYAYEGLGMLEWKNGNWAIARQCFVEGLKSNPNNLSYKMMIAASYVREKNKIEAKKFIDNNIRNMDKSSAEYYLMRLYLDGIAPNAVELKIRKEQSVALRGKLLFYLGMFYDLSGNDEMAKKYYTEIKDKQAPMMFEYQLNEWLLDGTCAPLHDPKVE